MNRYFTEVANNLGGKLLEDNSHIPRFFQIFSDPLDRSAYARPTDADEISQILRFLNPKAAMGVDQIRVRFLWDLGDDFARKMAEATNRALESGYYANPLKIARMTPLFKGGIQNLRCHYRRVSVNLNLSKVSENVIYTRLYNFATTNQLVSTSWVSRRDQAQPQQL